MALARLLPRPSARTRTDRGPTLARVIAFANQKGGVAKTTTTLNLGVALAEQGKKVLAIDLDPQGNLTMSQGWNPDEIDRSMFDVLVHKLPISEIVRYARTYPGILPVFTLITFTMTSNSLCGVSVCTAAGRRS